MTVLTPSYHAEVGIIDCTEIYGRKRYQNVTIYSHIFLVLLQVYLNLIAELFSRGQSVRSSTISLQFEMAISVSEDR